MDQVEPPRPAVGSRALLAALVSALLLAAVGVAIAPAPWPSGPGELEIGTRGLAPVRVPVSIGAGARIVVEKALPGDDGTVVRVVMPAGIPTDAPVQAEVSRIADGVPVRLGVGDVDLTILLSDGRRELVPTLRWDAEAGHLAASRRPPVRSRIVLGLLGLVIVLWITEVVPLFVTSLLVPVVIVTTGVGSADVALAPFFHPIIALFFGGFLMAEAMRRVGLDRRIAVSIVARAGRSPGLLFAALLGTAAFLSMWMSNTAATALLVPIAIAVTEPMGSLGYRKACVLGIAFAATAGGVGSVIGSPANPLAVEFLDTFAGRQLAFADWFAFGLPFVFLFLPLMGFYLWRRSNVRIEPARFAAARAAALAEERSAGPLGVGAWVVLGVLVLVVCAWLTQTWHGVSTGIVALAGAVLLALLGRVQPEDLQRISWASLLTFGGGLALGVFLGTSGTSDWLATRLAGLAVFDAWVGVVVVASVALGLTAVASNTASAALLIPVSIPLAGVLGIDPVQLVIIVAIASSIDFALVIGTPPTMIAYSTRLFTTREIFRTGIVLDLLGLALLVTIVAGIWHVLGLVG